MLQRFERERAEGAITDALSGGPADRAWRAGLSSAARVVSHWPAGAAQEVLRLSSNALRVREAGRMFRVMRALVGLMLPMAAAAQNTASPTCAEVSRDID